MTTPQPTPLPPPGKTGLAGGHSLAASGDPCIGPAFAAMAGRALGFIGCQLGGLVVPTESRAWVRPDSDWPSDYTGPVSGSFALAGTSDATTPCPITLADPNVTSLPPAWRGHAWGALAIPARAGLQVVAYQQAGTAYSQAGTATPDPSTGYWNIDLTAVPTWQGGSWRFALLDTSAGNAQVGEMWPSAPAYADIAVEHFVITDTRYPAGQVTATTTGRFALPASQPGAKGYQLARRSTGEILADCTPGTGAVRSYLVAPGEPGYGSAFVNQCYAYDQALCLFAAITAGRKDIADRLAGGLLLLQTPGGASDGGFIFSGQQQAPQFGDPAYRTGAHAVCTDALIAYIEAYCTSDFLSDGSAAPWSRTATLTAAARRALAYLATMLSHGGTTAGLYLGGTGTYDSANGGAFDPGLDLTWASTEHNLDAYHCLSRAGRVLGDPAYTAAADALAEVIHSQLWNAAAGRFHQGMQDTGPDTADPLDCHTWAAIFCTKTGRADRAQAITAPDVLAPYRYELHGGAGYAPVRPDDPGYPGAGPTIWAEGTLGAALAFLAIGDVPRWFQTIAGLAAIQNADGSFRYVTDVVSGYDWTPSRAVIGPAWLILATAGHGIWGVEPPAP